MSVLILPGRGFQLTFENGRTVSVMCGYGNYCENRYKREFYNYDTHPESLPLHTSATFEVAGWNEGRAYAEWIDFGNDKVAGWLSLRGVLNFAQFMQDSTPEDLKYRVHNMDTGESNLALSTNAYAKSVCFFDRSTLAWEPVFTEADNAEDALQTLIRAVYY